MAKAESQKSLSNWTKEDWGTKSGKNSTQGSKATGERYLPKKAWASLSKEEREETDAKKRAGSRKGKQFVPNTETAKKAGKAARAAKMHKSKGS